MLTRIILGGVCDIINVRLEEKEPEDVLETRAEREREREREREIETIIYTLAKLAICYFILHFGY